MTMTPEELKNHKALLARMGMTYTEPFGPTDMSAPDVQKRMRDVATTAVRMPSVFNLQNDFDLANQVRMLTHTDSGHEGVVCAARDRIFQLSLKVATTTAALQSILNAMPTDKPEEEDYDDTESAYNNGMEVGLWEAGQIARGALLEIGYLVEADPEIFTGWFGRDALAAQAEGWDIFEASGTLEIEADDEAGKFPDGDEGAFAFVKGKAICGSDLHKRAVAIHMEGAAERAATAKGWRQEREGLFIATTEPDVGLTWEATSWATLCEVAGIEVSAGGRPSNLGESAL